MPFGDSFQTSLYALQQDLNLPASENDNVPIPDLYPLFRVIPVGDCTVTGIKARDIRQLICLMNPSPYLVILSHRSGASEPENQFWCPGAVDFGLLPGEGVSIWRDEDPGGWRFLTPGRYPGSARYSGAKSGIVTPFGLVNGVDAKVPCTLSIRDTDGYVLDGAFHITAPGEYCYGGTIEFLGATVPDATRFTAEARLYVNAVVGARAQVGPLGLSIGGISFNSTLPRVCVVDQSLLAVNDVVSLHAFWCDDTFLTTGVSVFSCAFWIFKVDGWTLSSGGPGLPGGAVGSVQFNAGGGRFGGYDLVPPRWGGTGMDSSSGNGRPVVIGGLWSLRNINLASEVFGDLSTDHLDGGIGADTTTFWRGDGQWHVPPGSPPGGAVGSIQYNAGGGAFGGEALVPTDHGGTGLDGSAAANGQLLIGDGSGYSLATLTAGANVTITNAPGSITIAAAGSVASISIGSPVTSGTPTLILFIDGSGNLAQDANLSWDGSKFRAVKGEFSNVIYDALFCDGLAGQFSDGVRIVTVCDGTNAVKYVATVPGDWAGGAPPTDVWVALDRIAAALSALGAPP